VDDVLARIEQALRPLSDPKRGAEMRAYMKDVAPFLGIGAPNRRAACKSACADLGTPTEQELAEAARALFAFDEREFHYTGIDLLGRFIRPKRSPVDAGFLDTVEELARTKSWWDSVDALRGEAVTPLVVRNPDLVSEMRRWNTQDDIWLVRLSIIHQLGRKDETDAPLLFELCERRADDTEFFIAKAIGWALRDYSYTNPSAVETFVASTKLQALSRREALKAIARRAES
jgi:3-methyladenine DNA glycosylase AlkD